jgi:hypothetical protein
MNLSPTGPSSLLGFLRDTHQVFLVVTCEFGLEPVVFLRVRLS